MSTEIRGLLQFEKGSIKSLTLTPNEKKDPTASLRLSAELTPQNAEIIGCKEAVFRSDDKPHSRVTGFDLGGMILRDIDLSLPNVHNGGFDTYRPEDISSFKVEVDGMLVRVSMLARIKTRYLDLVDFLEQTNTDDFEFAIRSLQNEFDWNGKGGTGTRVEMSGDQNVAAGKKEENGPLFQSADDSAPDPAPESEGGPAEPPACLWCSREVPKNEDGWHMVEDGLANCTATEGASQELADQIVDLVTAANREPAIVDVRDMGLGTRLRRRLTRGDGNQSPEEIRREQISGDGIPVEDEPVIPVGAE